MRHEHIAILTFTYPPNKDGVAEASRSMAEGLANRGYQVTVGTTFHPDRAEPCSSNGVTVRQFRVSGSSAAGVGFAGEVDAFLDWLRQSQADVVIFHSWDCWTTDLALQCLPELSAKTILVSHGFSVHIPPWHGRFPWGLGVWLRWLPYVLRLPSMLRRYDHVTVLSDTRDFGRFFDHTIARLTNFRRISVIPNSAELPAARAPGAFRRNHQLGGAFLFLCVANYSERKNQAMALEAFYEARIPNGALVFIGSERNQYWHRLVALNHALSTTADSSRVLFLHGLNREETAKAFRDANAFLLTAKTETQPIVLLEAMACALPFISTDTGCARDLPGGTIVRSKHELVRAMKCFTSSANLQELGNEGRKAFFRTFTPQQVLDAYDELIQSLLPSANGSPVLH